MCLERSRILNFICARVYRFCCERRKALIWTALLIALFIVAYRISAPIREDHEGWKGIVISIVIGLVVCVLIAVSLCLLNNKRFSSSEATDRDHGSTQVIREPSEDIPLTITDHTLASSVLAIKGDRCGSCLDIPMQILNERTAGNYLQPSCSYQESSNVPQTVDALPENYGTFISESIEPRIQQRSDGLAATTSAKVPRGILKKPRTECPRGILKKPSTKRPRSASPTESDFQRQTYFRPPLLVDPKLLDLPGQDLTPYIHSEQVHVSEIALVSELLHASELGPPRQSPVSPSQSPESDFQRQTYFRPPLLTDPKSLDLQGQDLTPYIHSERVHVSEIALVSELLPASERLHISELGPPNQSLVSPSQSPDPRRQLPNLPRPKRGQSQQLISPPYEWNYLPRRWTNPPHQLPKEARCHRFDELEQDRPFDESDHGRPFGEPEGRRRFDEPEGRRRFDEPEGRRRLDEPEGRRRLDEPEGRRRLDEPEGSR